MLRSASFHPRAVLCVPLPAPHVRCLYTPHPLSTVSTVDAYHSLLNASCRPIFPAHNICALPRPPQLLPSPHFVAPPLCTQPLPGALRAPLSVRSVHTISNCAGGAHCADQRPHSDARAEPHRSTPSATPAQEGTREESGSKKSVKTRPSTRPMRGKSKAKWYAVARGREVGVFLTWEECSRMVTGFAGAMFKSFPSIDEAKAYVALHNRGSGASAGVGSIAGSGARVDGAHIAAASALHALRASAIASDLAVTHTSSSAPVHPPHHNSHALAAAHLAPSLQPATAGRTVVPPVVRAVVSNEEEVATAATATAAAAAAATRIVLPSNSCTSAAFSGTVLPHVSTSHAGAGIASKLVTLNFDGGARLHCQVAGAGCVATCDGRILFEGHWFLPDRTSNVAEYCGLLFGLRVCWLLGVRHVQLVGDSLLVVNQINGAWKCHHDDMKILHAQVTALLSRFSHWRATHVLRHLNPDADRLSTQAQDARDSQLHFRAALLELTHMSADELARVDFASCAVIPTGVEARHAASGATVSVGAKRPLVKAETTAASAEAGAADDGEAVASRHRTSKKFDA